jgi:hypothetical protein
MAKPPPDQQHTPHRSASAHTRTCRSKKLASTPPDLGGRAGELFAAVGAQPAAPAPCLPCPAGQWLGPPSGRPWRAGGAHLALRRAAAPGTGALCPPSGSRQGRASCRPLGCRPRRCRATAGSGRGHGPQFVAAAPGRTGARRFNRARAHTPGTENNSRGGRPRLAHAAEPPGLLHLPP